MLPLPSVGMKYMDLPTNHMYNHLVTTCMHVVFVILIDVPYEYMQMHIYSETDCSD